MKLNWTPPCFLQLSGWIWPLKSPKQLSKPHFHDGSGEKLLLFYLISFNFLDEKDCADPPALQQDLWGIVKGRPEGHTLTTSAGWVFFCCFFYLWKQELLRKGIIVNATYIYPLKELPLRSKLQCLCMDLGPWTKIESFLNPVCQRLRLSIDDPLKEKLNECLDLILAWQKC